MPFTVRQRLRVAWIALLAMLMSTFAPAITHAVVSAPMSWQSIGEVCSIDGASTVTQVNDDAPAPSPPAGHRPSAEHCPYCLTHAPHFPLPAPAAAMEASASAWSPMPRLYLQAPATLFSWLAAQPRAPPPLV